MSKSASAGNKGSSVRSDCFISLELKESGGIQIDLQSKVASLFGNSIVDLCKDELNYFGINNAKLTIEDSGALPFVISARLEAAIKKCITINKDYLLDLIPENNYNTTKDHFRRSRLYLPGNSPKLMLNAGVHKPDGIILDLEDSVAPSKKYEAQFLIRNALREINFYGTERMVRINQIPAGLDNLDFIIPHNVHVILVPKCESDEQIHLVNKQIEELRVNDNPIYLMPIIESALGVENAYKIASAAKNVASLAIGLEDYTADLGTKRTDGGKESFFARSRIVNAARAAGIQPIDSVFSDVSDMDALSRIVTESKSLGFDGMGCIHPRQIKVIHETYAPTDLEIDKAKKIVNAFFEAEEKGLGVVSLGSKMIDPPVVKRAQRVIDLAINTDLLSNDWRNKYVS
jgi:citrate lyase subunit beta / citryl-CoA lyase